MAFKKINMIELIRKTILVLIAVPLVVSSNIDCNGKSFHCVNSTHFMICVDLGGGVSSTIGDFIIQCPSPTECKITNYFECEFPQITTPAPTIDTSVSSVFGPSEITTETTSISTTAETTASDLPLTETNTVSILTLEGVNFTTPSFLAPVTVNPRPASDLMTTTELFFENSFIENITTSGDTFSNSIPTEKTEFDYTEVTTFASVILSTIKDTVENVVFNTTIATSTDAQLFENTLNTMSPNQSENVSYTFSTDIIVSNSTDINTATADISSTVKYTEETNVVDTTITDTSLVSQIATSGNILDGSLNQQTQTPQTGMSTTTISESYDTIQDVTQIPPAVLSTTTIIDDYSTTVDIISAPPIEMFATTATDNIYTTQGFSQTPTIEMTVTTITDNYNTGRDLSQTLPVETNTATKEDNYNTIRDFSQTSSIDTSTVTTRDNLYTPQDFSQTLPVEIITATTEDNYNKIRDLSRTSSVDTSTATTTDNLYTPKDFSQTLPVEIITVTTEDNYNAISDLSQTSSVDTSTATTTDNLYTPQDFGLPIEMSVATTTEITVLDFNQTSWVDTSTVTTTDSINTPQDFSQTLPIELTVATTTENYITGLYFNQTSSVDTSIVTRTDSLNTPHDFRQTLPIEMTVATTTDYNTERDFNQTSLADMSTTTIKDNPFSTMDLRQTYSTDTFTETTTDIYNTERYLSKTTPVDTSPTTIRENKLESGLSQILPVEITTEVTLNMYKTRQEVTQETPIEISTATVLENYNAIQDNYNTGGMLTQEHTIETTTSGTLNFSMNTSQFVTNNKNVVDITEKISTDIPGTLTSISENDSTNVGRNENETLAIANFETKLNNLTNHSSTKTYVTDINITESTTESVALFTDSIMLSSNVNISDDFTKNITDSNSKVYMNIENLSKGTKNNEDLSTTTNETKSHLYYTVEPLKSPLKPLMEDTSNVVKSLLDFENITEDSAPSSRVKASNKSEIFPYTTPVQIESKIEMDGESARKEVPSQVQELLVNKIVNTALNQTAVAPATDILESVTYESISAFSSVKHRATNTLDTMTTESSAKSISNMGDIMVNDSQVLSEPSHEIQTSTVTSETVIEGATLSNVMSTSLSDSASVVTDYKQMPEPNHEIYSATLTTVSKDPHMYNFKVKLHSDSIPVSVDRSIIEITTIPSEELKIIDIYESMSTREVIPVTTVQDILYDSRKEPLVSISGTITKTMHLVNAETTTGASSLLNNKLNTTSKNHKQLTKEMSITASNSTLINSSNGAIGTTNSAMVGNIIKSITSTSITDVNLFEQNVDTKQDITTMKTIITYFDTKTNVRNDTTNRKDLGALSQVSEVKTEFQKENMTNTTLKDGNTTMDNKRVTNFISDLRKYVVKNNVSTDPTNNVFSSTSSSTIVKDKMPRLENSITIPASTVMGMATVQSDNMQNTTYLSSHLNRTNRQEENVFSVPPKSIIGEISPENIALNSSTHGRSLGERNSTETLYAKISNSKSGTLGSNLTDPIAHEKVRREKNETEAYNIRNQSNKSLSLNDHKDVTTKTTSFSNTSPIAMDLTLKQKIPYIDSSNKTFQIDKVNHILLSFCQNRSRGRYADYDDCTKFYICIGRNEPIAGKCPANTVFSNLKKLCTKNKSHCVRGNEFKCISEGRFSDILKKNVYYICVNRNDSFTRFQFQCQIGFYLNKSSVKCLKEELLQEKTSIEKNSEIGSSESKISKESKVSKETRNNKTEKKFKKKDAELKTSKDHKNSKTEAKEEETKDKKDFECSKEGKFVDPNNCKKYYLCTKHKKSEFRRRRKSCESGEIFHKDKKKCVDEDSYEC